MVDGGYLGLAAAYCAVTLAAGYLFVRARDRARARRGEFVGRYPAASRHGAAAMSAPGWIAVGLLGGAAAAARFLIDAEIAARRDVTRSRSGSSPSTSAAPSRSASSPGRRCTARRW